MRTPSTNTDRLTPPDRLTQLCDRALERLYNAAHLIKRIRARDATSVNAAQWLSGMCRSLAYEGDVLCIGEVGAIFAELEELEANDEFARLNGGPSHER